jgi:hypothetical protein
MNLEPEFVMASSDTALIAPPQRIVFIDSNVPDIQDLLRGLEPDEQAFVLDPSSDGLDQIADILAANNLTNLSSISIVSHGASGEIELGSSTITGANLATHSHALAEIGAALMPGGAIQLYGCDVAQAPAGQQFIDNFSTFAGGVVVDASTQVVGSAAYGGTWALDASSIDTAAPAPGSQAPAGNGTVASLLNSVIPSGSVAGGAPNPPFTPAALANFQGDLAVTPNAEIWTVTAGGGKENTIDHVDNNNGSNTGSNLTVLYSQSTSAFDHLSDIVLDTNDGKFFAVDSNADGHNKIVEGSLFDPGPTPTLTTIYSDTLGNATNISAIAIDPVNHQLYFTENVATNATSFSQGQFERINYTPTGTTGTNLVTLATVTDSGANAGFEDFALDLAHGTAFFTSSAAHFATSYITLTRNFLYKATGVSSTASTVTMTELPIAGSGGSNSFPSADGVVEKIGVDSSTQIVYILAPATATTTHGGIYSYAVNGNAAGNFSTVWQQPTSNAIVNNTLTNSPYGGLQAIDLDAADGVYYLSVGGKFNITGGKSGPSDDHVYVGSLSGGTPTAFTQVMVNNPGPTDLIVGGMAIDNAPVLSITALSPTWTEEGANVALISNATATDSDNTSLASATVSISGGFFSGDTLTFSNNNNITGSYNSSTGVLTFSGIDSLADYQTALQSVQYHGGENPTGFSRTDTSRTLTWTVSDGLLSSAAQTSSVSVVFVNDPPTLTPTASAHYTEEGAAATLSGALSVIDADDLNLSSATVSITGGTFGGDGDVLATTTTGTSITASYNSSTETLTLTGTDTLAHYQQVLDAVTFSAGENPTNYGSNQTRLVTWVAKDPSGTANGGSDTSALATTTLTVTNVNDPPTLSNVATSAHYTQGGASVTLSPSVTVTDADDLDLSSATVSITGGAFAGDVLAAITAGTSIAASYNSSTETLTLTGTDTLAHYQSVLDSVTFNNTGLNPTDYGSDPTRTVTWVTKDPSGTASGGSDTSGAATTTVSITAVNQPPTLANVSTGASYTQGGGAVTLSGAVSVSDPDNLDLTAATVSIGGGTFAGDGDALAATTTGTSIAASYNSTTETLTLSGSDTLAHYQSVLDTITFNNTSANPTDYGSDPSRTITWVLNDGGASNNLSTTATTTVSITAVNQPPTLGSVATSAHYTQGGASVTLSPSATVSDPDNLDLSSATVSIAGGAFTGDVLGFSIAGTSIAASYNSATETLTLSGSDTLAHYQSVLDTVTFNNSSLNPTD